MKLVKYFFLVVAITLGIGMIATLFSSEEDMARAHIENIHEDMPEAESADDVNQSIREVDSIVNEFPDLKPVADSLIYQQKDEWLTEVKEDEEDSHMHQAYQVSKDLVKKRLKSPSTATFPEYLNDEIKVWREDDIFISQFWCDSENAFGANLRSNWQVKLRREGDEFKVVDVTDY